MTSSRYAGADEEEFRRLNPAYRAEVVSGKLRVPANEAIRVPSGAGQRFELAYATLTPDQRRSSQNVIYSTHVVARGDNIAKIAKRYGLSQREILVANNLGSAAKLRRGQKLQIPSTGDAIEVADAAPTAAETAQALKVKATAPTASGTAAASASSVAASEHRTHRVRAGQTLGAIAKRYRTSTNVLRELNGFGESHVLRAGATIKVPRG